MKKQLLSLILVTLGLAASLMLGIMIGNNDIKTETEIETVYVPVSDVELAQRYMESELCDYDCVYFEIVDSDDEWIYANYYDENGNRKFYGQFNRDYYLNKLYKYQN